MCSDFPCQILFLKVVVPGLEWVDLRSKQVLVEVESLPELQNLQPQRVNGGERESTREKAAAAAAESE